MLTVALVSSMGCATSTMRTARQLEAGDFVFSGGLDVPGSGAVPRVSGQAMYGLGVGDLSLHGGSSAFAFNAGLGGRAYLGDSWTAALQADASYQWFASAAFGALTQYSGMLQVTTAAKKKSALYGGFHTSIYAFTEDSSFGPPLMMAGLVGGLDVLLSEDFGLQFEVRASPVFYDFELGPGVALVGDDLTNAFLYAGQAGVSLYKRWPARDNIEPSEDFVPAPQWVYPSIQKETTQDEAQKEARPAPARSPRVPESTKGPDPKSKVEQSLMPEPAEERGEQEEPTPQEDAPVPPMPD